MIPELPTPRSEPKAGAEAAATCRASRGKSESATARERGTGSHGQAAGGARTRDAAAAVAMSDRRGRRGGVGPPVGRGFDLRTTAEGRERRGGGFIEGNGKGKGKP